MGELEFSRHGEPRRPPARAWRRRRRPPGAPDRLAPAQLRVANGQARAGTAFKSGRASPPGVRAGLRDPGPEQDGACRVLEPASRSRSPPPPLSLRVTLSEAVSGAGAKCSAQRDRGATPTASCAARRTRFAALGPTPAALSPPHTRGPRLGAPPLSLSVTHFQATPGSPGASRGRAGGGSGAWGANVSLELLGCTLVLRAGTRPVPPTWLSERLWPGAAARDVGDCLGPATQGAPPGGGAPSAEIMRRYL